MVTPTAVRTALVLLALLPAAQPLSAQTTPTDWRSYEGIARELDSDTLLYRERHYQRFEAGQLRERVVAYVCPDSDTVFARKRIDYRPSSIAPAFELQDARSDYREGLIWERPDRVRIYAGPRTGTVASALRPAGEWLVADAGFDEFVRARWAQLRAGQSQRLRFTVPARADDYRFRVQSDGVRTWAEREALRLRLGLDGPLGWFTPDIEVFYDLQSQRLLHYRGLSNLRSAEGGQLSAAISFPEPASPVTATEVDRTLAQVLVGCPAQPDDAGKLADTGRTSTIGQPDSAP